MLDWCWGWVAHLAETGGVVAPAARPLRPHLPHLGAGRGRAACLGRYRAGAVLLPPDYNPELASAPLGRPRRLARSGILGCECGSRGSGRGHRDVLLILRGARPGAPSARGCTVWKVQAPRPSWSMAPPRDVVKIAIQMREAIPQLIQLDQVTRPVRPTSTPQPTSGLPPSHWNGPPHPFPRFSPNLTHSWP